MAEELGFTSTPQGLDPAASGYCTVFRTPGVTKTLQFELEALSVYRPQFPPGSPNEAQNPSNYSHQIINDGRRRWHVVSRTGYAGTDYTGRNNHFSHHVLLGPDERPTNGPAWLASRDGFLDRQWNGQTQVLSGARSSPYDDGKGQPGVCRLWEDTVGDAGWAGRLVQAYLEAPSLPCYLIYRPRQAILPLIVEALALLPPEQRWNVTFCTYYTAGGKNDCLWRGVLEGTPEAEQALRSSDRSRVFDLRSRQLGLAPTSEWSAYARSGEPPERIAASRDNGGSTIPGNGGYRTGTVVVPKRRSSAPAEEFALPVAALEVAAAPAVAPAPPPPPPPQVQPKSTLLFLVAAMVGVPIAMVVSSWLAWQIATGNERRRQEDLREKEIQRLMGDARAEADRQNKDAENKINDVTAEAKTEQTEQDKQQGELERKLNQALTDKKKAEDELANEWIENFLLWAELEKVQRASPGATAEAHSGGTEQEGVGGSNGHRPDGESKYFKPIYLGPKNSFVADGRPQAILVPALNGKRSPRVELNPPTGNEHAWQISHDKPLAKLSHSGSEWILVPEELDSAELTLLGWLAIDFGNQIACLRGGPAFGKFTDNGPKVTPGGSTVTYVTYAILLSDDLPEADLLPSHVTLEGNSSGQPRIFHLTGADRILDVDLGGGRSEQVPDRRDGWTFNRLNERWVLSLSITAKAIKPIKNSKLKALRLRYRVVRGMPSGQKLNEQAPAGDLYLPLGIWERAPDAQPEDKEKVAEQTAD